MTIATNVTKNCHSKKVRYCYILHNFISDYMAIDNYYYLLSLCETFKTKKVLIN